MKAPGEVSLRLAGEEDVEAVILLDRALDTLPHWSAAEYHAAIAGFDPDRLRCLFVAEVEGQVVGLAVGRVDRIAGERSGELESIGVAVLAQRRGVGRELCHSVIGWCRSQGASHLDLEVRSQSAGVISLYRQLGFEVVGKRRNYYRDPVDDAILMRLDLKRERSDRVAPAQPAS